MMGNRHIKGNSITLIIFLITITLIYFPILAFQAIYPYQSSNQVMKLIGGDDIDIPQKVRTLDNGDFILVGNAESNNFPVTHSISNNVDLMDVFITKFSKSGFILWSTLLGGSGSDYGLDMEIDSNKNIVFAGGTFSDDLMTKNAYQSINNKSSSLTTSGFVAKLNPKGKLLWSTYLGGSKDDRISSITIDNEDSIIVVGKTFSEDFIGVNEEDLFNGNGNVFTSKLSSDGQLIWSKRFASEFQPVLHWQEGLDVVTNNKNDIFVLGTTSSNSFPRENFSDNENMGGKEIFLLKLDSAGNLIRNRFLGGSGKEENAQFILYKDKLLIVGITRSQDFPVMTPTYEYGNNTISDFSSYFYTVLDLDGQMISSTYIPNIKIDLILIDKNENVVFGGTTLNPSIISVQSVLNNPLTESTNLDLYSAIFYQNGTFIEISYYGGSDREQNFVMDLQSDGSLVVAGETFSSDIEVNGGDTNEEHPIFGATTFILIIIENPKFAFSDNFLMINEYITYRKIRVILQLVVVMIFVIVIKTVKILKFEDKSTDLSELNKLYTQNNKRD